MKSAGTLRHRIDVEQKGTGTSDGYGNQTQAWTTLYANVPAEIVPSSARELFAGEKVETLCTHVVSIRYIANINSKMRIKFGTRIFSILGVINPLERNIDLKLACTEQF